MEILSLSLSLATSHGVGHPVDHVDHGEGEGEDGAGVDVDGVRVDGLADALAAALPVLLALLRLPGPPPPLGLGVLPGPASPIRGGVCARALAAAVAVGDQDPLVHAGDGQGEEDHGLLAVLHDGLGGGREGGRDKQREGGSEGQTETEWESEG